VAFAIAFAAALIIVPPAPAAFHLWGINEIYTNSTGTLQFIEFFTADDFQQFVNGQNVQSQNVGATITNNFVIPSDLPGSTTNRHFLIGTAGIAAAGGPTPDYIMPNNFLFAAGGTLNFFGTNGGPYSALPTDGLLSRDWASGTNSLNTPTNFAGGTGTVVPEPSTLVLSSVGVGLYGVIHRRWRRKTATAPPSSE
jgi:hypothetical protein